MLKIRSIRVPPIIICLSVAACLATQPASAQDRLSAIIISVDRQDGTLGGLLNEISSLSGISFSYNPKRIPVYRNVNYRADGKRLSEILDDLSSAYGLTFELVENQIIVKAEKKAATVTLSGTVTDDRSGEALISASVYVRELQTGAVTNAFGFYSLTFPAGAYTVDFTFVGYGDTTLVLDLQHSARTDLQLREAAPLLGEIVVRSVPTVVDAVVTGNASIRASSVEDRPEIFGEQDVVKSLESIPGVKFHSDGSTFYYVRGGHRDQNVVFVDDAPVYNPSHLLGMFSTIIPDAVNNITLYKGDMPASLGGRLSSVLDVRTKKGNDQHFSAWGSVGLISARAGIEGPFQKGRSSYMLSARASSLGWLFRSSDANIDEFSFYDLTSKLNFTLNRKNRVYFSFYSGADNYFGNTNGISWSNRTATLQWNHLFNDRLFLNTTIAGGGYDYNLHTHLKSGTKWNAHISNLNVKGDFSYFLDPDNELTFGAGLNGYGFNPGNLQSRVDLTMFPVISKRNSGELVLYFNHELRKNKLAVNYGVRLTSWTNIGEAFEYRFDGNELPYDTLYYGKGRAYNNFLKAEPRITVSYVADDRSSLKASFSRNVQNIHLISNSISPFTSLDIWLPSSFNVRPQYSNQSTVGYYKDLGSKLVSLSIEVFYKKMWNQIDYEPHAQILLNPLLERELQFGIGRAYGLEFLAKKDEGKLRGWIGYTWSRAKRIFPGINNGIVYNAIFDRPHQFNATASFDLSRRWQVAANFNYSTGAPYTAPVSFFSYNGEEVPVYGQKNNARLPDYHRLDISATHRLNASPEKRFQHHLSFAVFNFYGRKNALFINFNKTESESGSLVIPGDLNEAQRVTSQFYLYGFTPSVSYSFRWR